MHKFFTFLLAVFFAMGSMLSLTPREGRTREVYTAPDDEPSQGIARHFEAAWDWIGKAVEKYEQ